MKSKNIFPGILLIGVLITFSGSILAQKNNEKFIATMLSKIKETYGRELMFASSNIKHIYEISIPANATIEDMGTNYRINPVEITLAVDNGYYTVYKAKINYKVTIFKEQVNTPGVNFYKGSETVLWLVKNETTEFMKIVKGLKSLADTEFDLLYGPEDDFPAEWKKDRKSVV